MAQTVPAGDDASFAAFNGSDELVRCHGRRERHVRLPAKCELPAQALLEPSAKGVG